jgi:DNA-binding transcriptional MocR family regulator
VPNPGTPWSVGDPAIEDSIEGPETGPIPMQSNVPPPGTEVGLFRRTLMEMAEAPGIGDLLAYHPRNATKRFRQAGVSWLARRGLEAGEDDIALAAGAHNGLMSTFATILKPGQRVMTEALSYPGIKTVAKLLDLTLVPGELDHEGLMPGAVADAAAAGRIDAVYVVPVLQNPTNAIMSEARRAELGAVCERYEIPIIEDDICGLFVEDAPAPVVRHAPRMGYYVTSLSKTLAPGLRIGFVRTPHRMRDYVAASVRASRWIESGAADAVLVERRQKLISRAQAAARIFDGLPYRMPDGALHIWLQLPAPWRASQFVAAAAAQEVVLTAAHAFTIGDAPSPGSVRICLGGPRSEDRLVEGLTRLRRILDHVDPLANAEVM